MFLLRTFKTKQLIRKLQYCNIHYDVVIVGGGVMGSSSAFFIKEKEPALNVAVIERDFTYSVASSPKSVGSIREQFSNVENIKLSQWGSKFFRNINTRLAINGEVHSDISFVQGSYMFMASDKGKHILKSNCDIQRDCGVDIKYVDVKDLEEKHNWINKNGIAAVSLYRGINEGYFDPWSLLMAFRKKAESMGVTYLLSDCTCIDIHSKIKGVKVIKDSETHEIECSKLLNAAGPWAGELVAKAGINLPVEPRKRYVFAFDCPNGPGRDMPLTIDPTGVYCRPEGNGTLYLSGSSPKKDEEPDTSNLEVDYDYFESFIWPVLANRYNGMEELKLRHSWAGFYDYNTLDQNGIIGPHDEVENLFFANGFSGHGIQQSPAVGNAISELMTDGKFSEIDLSKLGYERITRKEPVFEINIV